MDSKDIELKNALDEIFGDDIIELDEDIPVIEKKEPTNEELFENTSTLVFNSGDIINTKEQLNQSNGYVINNAETTVIPEYTTYENDESSSSVINDYSIPVIDVKKDETTNDGEKTINEDNIEIVENHDNNIEELEASDTKNSDGKNINIVKVVIISIFVVLLTLVGVYLVINYYGNKEKVINCSYSFDDKNYKITDEYKITFKNKNITYIEGIYIYSSKTNEYDEQIKYIKEDKLPAIINSNGMKGFTYTYENTEDSIKISSYLDYTIMDNEEIKGIDQNIKPISYFNVDLEENSKNLINLFEKQGYKCISNK